MPRRERPRRPQAARRDSTGRMLLKALIVLTLPCYCLGGAIFVGARAWSAYQMGAGWAPWVLLGLGLAGLLVLTEPLHGGITGGTELGMELFEATDPVGCGSIIILLGLLGLGLFWFLGRGLPFALTP